MRTRTRLTGMMKCLATTAAAGLMAVSVSGGAQASDPLPIVFVHGDSDSASTWIAQKWRFESNGYPRDRMFAVDLDHPGARSDDTVPQENRSSTTDVAAQLAGFVARVKLETGADKVVMVGNSRGCQTIRNYVQNAGGAANAAALILTGCVHHGVFVAPGAVMGSEYNGAGTFLSGLNAVSEVVPGLPTVTIRSDRFDLYAQPMGDFIGRAGQPTGATYENAELRGATNIVLDGVDHRETAYSTRAFHEMFKVVAGHPTFSAAVTPEETPVLNGEVSGWAADRPTNLPLVGSEVSVFETDPENGARMGEPVHVQTIGADGMWGPFEAKNDQTYEFRIEAEGFPVHHIYRSAFPRSSDLVNLRLYPQAKEAEGQAGALQMMRPRGYFGADDTVSFNGERASGLNDHEVPNGWKVWITFPEGSGQTVVGRFADGDVDETIAAKAWPVDGHVAWIELTY